MKYIYILNRGTKDVLLAVPPLRQRKSSFVPSSLKRRVMPYTEAINIYINITHATSIFQIGVLQHEYLMSGIIYSFTKAILVFFLV